jgi:DNA adenine methylase
MNGVYQTIINHIPPHDIYIEPFLGQGAVLRHKRPAARSVGIDIDLKILSQWSCHTIPSLELFHCDAIEWLKHAFAIYRLSASSPIDRVCAMERPAAPPHSHARCFIYADPPYLKATRRSARSPYRYQLSDEHHIELLTVLKQLPVSVMVSSYPSDIYTTLLADWRLLRFTVSTRANHAATECLWMNYEHPSALHDYAFIGSNRRQRERIRRRLNNWHSRLARLPELERRAVLASLQSTLMTDPRRIDTMV